MSWYKKAQEEIVIGSYGNWGITVYINGTKYYCSQFKPKEFAYLRQLIRNKAFGKAKQLIKNWPCINEYKEKLKALNERRNEQFKLFAQKVNYYNPNMTYEDQDLPYYFEIGHGDFDEVQGFEPIFYVWIERNNEIEAIGPFASEDRLKNDEKAYNEFKKGNLLEDSVNTHGIWWGDLRDHAYRGRYEPETGRLSIVLPHPQKRVDPDVMQKIYRFFKGIKQIFVY